MRQMERSASEGQLGWRYQLWWVKGWGRNSTSLVYCMCTGLAGQARLRQASQARNELASPAVLRAQYAYCQDPRISDKRRGFNSRRTYQVLHRPFLQEILVMSHLLYSGTDHLILNSVPSFKAWRCALGLLIRDLACLSLPIDAVIGQLGLLVLDRASGQRGRQALCRPK
jgi:hypothetical protein